MNSFRPAKLWTRNIIWALCIVCVKLFASRDRVCGKTTLGFCSTIMHRLTLHSFFVTISPKTQHISFHNHYIRLIWLRVTSSYSPNSKDHSVDTVLTRLKRYESNRRRPWRQFRKSNLTSVSTIGKNGWHKCIISGGDHFGGDEIDSDKWIKIFHFITIFTLIFSHSSIFFL